MPTANGKKHQQISENVPVFALEYQDGAYYKICLLDRRDPLTCINT